MQPIFKFYLKAEIYFLIEVFLGVAVLTAEGPLYVLFNVLEY